MTPRTSLLSTRFLFLVFASLAAGCSTAAKSESPRVASKEVSTPASSTTPAPSTSPAPGAESASVSGTTAPEKGALERRCVLNEDVRTLSIVPTAEGCELHYAKFGSSEIVARSEKSATYCDNVSENIRKNLEAAGYTCR